MVLAVAFFATLLVSSGLVAAGLFLEQRQRRERQLAFDRRRIWAANRGRLLKPLARELVDATSNPDHRRRGCFAAIGIVGAIYAWIAFAVFALCWAAVVAIRAALA